MRTQRRGAIAAVAVSLTALAGCGSSEGPTAAAASKTPSASDAGSRAVAAYTLGHPVPGEPKTAAMTKAALPTLPELGVPAAPYGGGQVNAPSSCTALAKALAEVPESGTYTPKAPGATGYSKTAGTRVAHLVTLPGSARDYVAKVAATAAGCAKPVTAVNASGFPAGSYAAADTIVRKGTNVGYYLLLIPSSGHQLLYQWGTVGTGQAAAVLTSLKKAARRAQL